jgi:hypothetical protein
MSERENSTTAGHTLLMNRDRVDFSDHARIAGALEISRKHPCAGLAPCGWDCTCWREAANHD